MVKDMTALAVVGSRQLSELSSLLNRFGMIQFEPKNYLSLDVSKKKKDFKCKMSKQFPSTPPVTIKTYRLRTSH
jgi:hypothetical protein